jgi:hypothetical protein
MMRVVAGAVLIAVMFIAALSLGPTGDVVGLRPFGPDLSTGCVYYNPYQGICPLPR